MFIGHFGIAFAARRIAPQVSLGTAFLAAQFLDLLWPTLLLAGRESVRIVPGATAVTPLVFEHYPISHSLLMAIAWALVLGGAYGAWRRKLRPETERLRTLTDPHSPAFWRVNGPLSNMKEFQAAFGCTDGDPMVNPASMRAESW